MGTITFESIRVDAFPVTVFFLVFGENRDTGLSPAAKKREMETLIVWNIKKKLDVKLELHSITRQLKSMKMDDNGMKRTIPKRVK